MKLVDKTTERQSTSTTLTAIPVGTTFRGSVIGKRTGKRFTGIFFKYENGVCVQTDPYVSTDVVVIQLSGDRQGTSGLWTDCMPVYDYEPLDADLVIKGVQR